MDMLKFAVFDCENEMHDAFGNLAEAVKAANDIPYGRVVCERISTSGHRYFDTIYLNTVYINVLLEAVEPTSPSYPAESLDSEPRYVPAGAVEEIIVSNIPLESENETIASNKGEITIPAEEIAPPLKPVLKHCTDCEANFEVHPDDHECHNLECEGTLIPAE